MGNNKLRIVKPLTLCLLAAVCVSVAADAFAQSSLGIGRAEPNVPTGGFGESYFAWIRAQQAEFQQSIREILLAMREDGTYVWSLIGLSFVYGVFHAIGPGHGKVVVSSYMLANEVAARRGIVLSMAAAVMQGVTAVTAITVFMLLLRGSGIKTADMTYGMEVASYVGVTAIGAWLLWRKLFSKGHNHDHAHDHGHGHNHDHDHSHSHGHGHKHDHHHHNDLACDHCGHTHVADPKKFEETFDLREAWSTILAIGLRPCTGALIVLVFCFANGLYFAGVFSTFAMAIGTGMTVSAMAMLAVTAKNAAIRFANFQDQTAIVHKTIEVAGASFILLIGLVLLYASISG